MMRPAQISSSTMGVRRRNGALAICCLLCASGLAAADRWWNPAWSARRPIEIRPTGAGVSGNETGVIQLRGMGHIASKDGHDIRIISEGQPVPLKVMHIDSDVAVVAFRMGRAAKDYWAYFGNAKATAVSGKWEPERGLWLETRRYNGGNCRNWPQMKDLIKKSGPAFGVGPVSNVFLGWNPFSAQEKWVSIYKGFLLCHKSGDYTFATSSDDASFLFVNDKLVTQFPGWHGPVGRARFKGTIQLTGGVHKFAYYHVNGSNTGMMAAYWQPPGQKKVLPIPATAFTPVAKGRPGLIELRTGAAVDAEMTLVGEAYVGERPLLRYRFRARAARSPRKVSWDFGDGQTAEGEIVEHVYVKPGHFPVKVEAVVSGSPAKAQTVLHAQIDLEKQAQHTKDKPGPFLEAVRKYDFERMDTSSLETASALFFLLNDVDGQIATARALIARPKLSVPLYFEQAMRLQQLLRDQKKDPDGALAVLAASETKVKSDKNRRAKILREIGDVYYYHKQDLDRALLEYDKVVGRYFGLEDNIVRVTKIRIGDIMRERGNYEKAARNYADAERVRIDQWTAERQPVRLGMLVHATEDFLRRGNATEARKWLEIWEWEFPVERLRGQSSILRAKIALLEKNVPEAVKQLEALVRVNPESQYAGEALFMLAKQALAQDDKEKAKKLLTDLVEKHPESEMAPRADELLTEWKGGKKATGTGSTQTPPKRSIVNPPTIRLPEAPEKKDK